MTQLYPHPRHVARAADDLRRLTPVAITDDTGALVILPLEYANHTELATFDGMLEHLNKTPQDSFILLTGQRAETIKVANKGWSAVRIERPDWLTPREMVALADPTADLVIPFKGPYKRIDHTEGPLDKAAIKLLKLARLMPAALAVMVTGEVAPGLLTVRADDVLAHDMLAVEQLRIVASAPVPLAESEKTRLISFRSMLGGQEHMAIVIGDPNRHDPVLMRLHSECFTGDLMGSLKCDCGQQLRGAIGEIEKAGGGLVLYMAQEGRGIGLISKLKAYALQAEGYDTVDANIRLGFETDERDFAPAVAMLQMLGFSSIRLMTNNPNKVQAFEDHGITVAQRVGHAFPPNAHNRHYLDTKRDRTGHML